MIAVLENEELDVDLANIRNQIEQSRLQQAIHRENDETAKEQAEAAKCRSLKKKEAEIRPRSTA